MRSPRPLVRRAVATAVGALVLAGIVACQPSFPSGSAITATRLGPLVRLDWTPATGDADRPVTRYEIEVDGARIATVAAPAAACVVTGLTPGEHVLAVTASNAHGEWSGDRTDGGARLSVRSVAPAGLAAGPLGCVPATDSDGDRLPDAVETGTGRYASAASTGSSPTVADTDGDALDDGDEVLGTAAGLDLPAFGVSPVHKDILLEVDWFDDARPDCPAHSHRPTPVSMGKLVTMFADSPVANPDGTTGVALHGDYGQGGPFTGGNLVPDADGAIAGEQDDADFTGIKAANFAPERLGSFHYALSVHNYDTDSLSGGVAEGPGDDLVVSPQCPWDQGLANMTAHELGHNLGLTHGGNDGFNDKPNYNSVMNYRFGYPGVDDNCTLLGNDILDYSSGTRAPLDEHALIEADGICDHKAIDWNGNGTIDTTPIAADINDDGRLSVLRDHDDWAALDFGGIRPRSGSAARSLRPIVVQEDHLVRTQAAG